ncbi:MAG: DUF4387 domain-containing protein [Nitrospinota bacterium]
MPILGEMATLIRSKNAGPFNLTFDIMFEEVENYQKVIASNVLTKEVFSRLYGIPVEEVLLVHHDAARAIKVSIPRPIFQCDLEDGDTYGGQQYGPLVSMEVPA